MSDECCLDSVADLLLHSPAFRVRDAVHVSHPLWVLKYPLNEPLMHARGASKRLHGVPQALEVSSVFLYALLFSLGVEVECLHGLYKVEDFLFVIVESAAYALDIPDELLERLFLLSFVPVVGQLKFVPHLLGTLPNFSCLFATVLTSSAMIIFGLLHLLRTHPQLAVA